MLGTLHVISPGKALAQSCNPRDSANANETGQSFISRCKKGSIDSVFPGEFLDSTLGEIFAGSTAKHKTAQKLLTAKIYDKYEPAPAVSPSIQTTTTAGDAYWEVTANRDPEHDQSLVFAFGDGGSESRSISKGTGTVTLGFDHNLGGMGQPEDFHTQTIYIAGGISEGVQLPDGDYRHARANHGC